jgi:GDP-L-fucose synthase
MEIIMNLKDKIYIAGHRGLVGSAIVRHLSTQGFTNLLYRTHEELDLTDQASVNAFFKTEKPDYVFVAAAKVGGIHANNTYRADFIYQNLAIGMNIINAAHNYQVKRLLYLASSCSYPRDNTQPIKENDLLTGALEPTNEPYAIAKIAGIKLCEAYNHQHKTNFISAIPTNVYGPGDNFDLQNSHVLPALLRKAHEAKVNNQSSLTLWGTGIALRDLMHVNDLADACLFIMNQATPPEKINISGNEEISIKELAELVCDTVGFKGNLIFDAEKPNGMLRKKLDSTQLAHLGWQPKITLKQGVKETYQWFLGNVATCVS